MSTQDNSLSGPFGTLKCSSPPQSLQGGERTSEPEFYTIGDIARAYGVSLRALRFYEERQLLQPERRGMVRLYDAQARARLELILKGKQLGFTLTEIRDLLENGADPALGGGLPLAPAQVLEQIAMLERQRTEIDQAIQELRATQLRMEEQEDQPERRFQVA